MWYRSFPALLERTLDLRDQFTAKCKELGVSEGDVLRDFRDDFLTRAVQESNWQEGLQMERGKTQKFAAMALGKLDDIVGPSVDINRIATLHQNSVTALFEKGASVEEVGAFNLSFAHYAVAILVQEIAIRELAAATKPITEIVAKMRERGDTNTENYHKGVEILEDNWEDESRVVLRLVGGSLSAEEFKNGLLAVDLEELMNPVRCAHIHFLHRLTMMGMLPPQECGKFRTEAVNVGVPDLIFPPASAVPSIMERYCHDFPQLAPLPWDAKQTILDAAKFSHRFVHIHPYTDGNGRVSRLLMNLILTGRFPPVYLKAKNAKGRRKYVQALKRADRGNHEPFAALICMSLIESYEKMLGALSR